MSLLSQTIEIFYGKCSENYPQADGLYPHKIKSVILKIACKHGNLSANYGKIR